jgi:hypothetical protein
MHVLEARGLRAYVASAQNMVLVASNGEDFIPAILDGNAAHGLAEMAGPKMRIALGSSVGHGTLRFIPATSSVSSW